MSYWHFWRWQNYQQAVSLKIRGQTTFKDCYKFKTQALYKSRKRGLSPVVVDE